VTDAAIPRAAIVAEMQSPESILVIFTALATAVAVGLVGLGWRGRRVDDHPVCRKCGFDLFGLPPSSLKCPECGAQLDRPRAVRVGRMERRSGALAVGLALGLMALGVWALLGVSTYRGTDLLRYQPVWLLTRTARATDAAVSDRAYREFLRRLAAGRLVGNDLAPLVDHVLEVQADAHRPWRTIMGDVVERAWLSNAVNDERWRRYVEQVMASRLDFWFRERVSRDGSFGHGFVVGPPRGGTVATFETDLHLDIDCDSPNGLHFGPEQYLPSHTTRSEGYRSVRPFADRLKAGPHTARVTVSGSVVIAGASPWRAVDISFRFDRPWNLEDGPSATPLNEPTKADAVRRCVAVRYFRRYSSPELEVRVTNPPVPVAWEVRVSGSGVGADGSRPKIPFRVACGTGESVAVIDPFSMSHPPISGARVTVTLTPSRAAAEISRDLKAYWNGELEFPDVPTGN